MNIIELEDLVKGLPDDRLHQEAQNPTGQIPQYLTLSEIQRRTDMRERFKVASSEQPQGTIADQVMSKSMAGMQPQGEQGIASLQPQAMYGGGVVRMSGGGLTGFGDPRMALINRAAEKERERFLYEKARAEEMEIYNRSLSSLMGTGPNSEMPNFGKSVDSQMYPFMWPGSHGRTSKEAGSVDVQGPSPIQTQSTSAAQPDTLPEGGVKSLLDGGGSALSRLLAMESKTGVPDFTPQLDAQMALGTEKEQLYADLARQQTDSYQGLESLIAAQGADAWSNALVQLGAGIADDDLSGGLRRAGEVNAAGKAAARALEMEDRRGRMENSALARQLESQGKLARMDNSSAVLGMEMELEKMRMDAADKDFANTISILSTGAQIEAQNMRAIVDKKLQDGVRENEILRFVQTIAGPLIEKANMAVDPKDTELQLRNANAIIRGLLGGSPGLADQLLGSVQGPNTGADGAAGVGSDADIFRQFGVED